MSIPTEASDAGTFARQLARLVGPAVDAPDGSIAADEYLALGGAIATARQTTLTAIAQAFPQSANDLLPAWEAQLQLAVSPGATIAARRTAVLARIRASGGSPQRIIRAAEALTNSTVTVREYAYIDVLANPRRAFRFTLSIPVALFDDATFRAALDDTLQRCAPAHTTWTIATTSGFLRFGVTGAGFGVAPFAP